jgi:predicted ATPase with chaperone activity
MPHLPKMIPNGDVFVPEVPLDVRSTGVDAAFLTDLTLKLAYTTSQFSTEWASQRLCLSLPLVKEILEDLKSKQMLEALGASGPFGFRYGISKSGRERAARLFEISAYVGPAPVSLEAYTAMIEWQIENSPAISPEAVAAAIAELEIPDDARRMAGLAVSSGRSLFVFGPAGNGKTTLGRLLHNVLQGDIWVPHSLVVDNSVIQVFDSQCHQVAADPALDQRTIDQRWVRIRRPLIVVGGELTIEALDLAYSPVLKYYQAPLHVKSNCGLLLIDDFGRQRVDPRQLLNRWIIPLENQIDYLTLQTGQKIDIPFRQMLVFATNLDPQSVTDPAFLRRMGYRLHLASPSPERYAEIFKRYAAKVGIVADPGLIVRLIERYRAEARELRCCESRDLIERARDICRFSGQPPELNDAILDTAWTGYFGNKPMTVQENL